MLDEPRTIMLPDSSGHGNHIPVRINGNKKMRGCKYLIFDLPNGEYSAVKKEDLRALMFVLGTEDEQRKMGKRRITTVKKVGTMVSVTTTRNIAKGEKLQFPVTIEIPVDIQDKVLEEESI